MRMTIGPVAAAMLATTMLVMPAVAPSLNLGSATAHAAGVGGREDFDDQQSVRVGRPAHRGRR